uniref:26S proteasome regulatory subunit RPN11 C-terminal domain-containing protein n=1 Tax=Strombidium rassoulzadegani TaxID=1082188 RepID=A0A7S3CK60_9SPIT|mmetsp:Transcript_13227/g.22439  ORF Transcript_13227/g.22439 Transcript_13227/m.22439 type:complete len:176 (+) Transcript_13227:441-968(+)
MLNSKAVGVVVDPVQSVKGKVLIDAFRSIDPQYIMRGMEPRQTTSNIGHLSKPSIVALAHGLNKHYYSIAINYRKSEMEQRMLLNLNKVNWSNALKQKNYENHKKQNIETLKNLRRLTSEYNKWIQEENKQSEKEFVVSSVGKMNPKNHLMSNIEDTMNENVMECLGTMLNTVVF